MADLAEREARLEEWFSPGTEEAKLAAVALALARALRLGGEHDGPCDNLDVPYHKEVPCTLHEAMEAKRKEEALAEWAELLEGLGDG